MYTACATGKCGGAECALWWLVFVITPHIPTNVSLCVHALYGMAAASRRVIGYRADCCACRPFFRPFVVSFSEPPHPSRSSLSSCSLARGRTHNTHKVKSRLLIQYISTPLFTVAFFGQIVVQPSFSVPS